jgi:hypothetical protein
LKEYRASRTSAEVYINLRAGEVNIVPPDIPNYWCG